MAQRRKKKKSHLFSFGYLFEERFFLKSIRRVRGNSSSNCWALCMWEIDFFYISRPFVVACARPQREEKKFVVYDSKLFFFFGSNQTRRKNSETFLIYFRGELLLVVINSRTNRCDNVGHRVPSHLWFQLPYEHQRSVNTTVKMPTAGNESLFSYIIITSFSRKA